MCVQCLVRSLELRNTAAGVNTLMLCCAGMLIIASLPDSESGNGPQTPITSDKY